MKYTIMDREEAKKVTGWSTDMDHEYKGTLPGFFCGYNFEVSNRDGRVDFCSMHFSSLTPEEIMDTNEDWYADFLSDLSLTPTGRVIFRGYYTEEYDPEERDTYFVNVDPFKN